MDNERNPRRFESVYSKKVRAGKRRTYFFDVRRTKGDDFYLTLTESTKRFNGDGYERHKIFLYKEDFNRFMTTLEDVINHIKTELMPEYDYDEYTRRHEEWEKERELQAAQAQAQAPAETEAESKQAETTEEEIEEIENTEVQSEDDMSW